MKNLRIVLKRTTINKVFPQLSGVPVEKGHELAMFKSGAKLYYVAPGQWVIGGYHYNGQDVVDAVREIMDHV